MGLILKSKWFRSFDWLLFFSALTLSCAGLVTMNSFVGESYFFEKQVVVLGISLCVCLFLSLFDFRFLKKTEVVVGLYGLIIALLGFLLIVGQVTNGAKGWLNLGFFSLQPSEFAKIALILLLSKYFARRHTEIANIKHIIISGFYAFVLFLLVAMQPDFGSAVVIFLIWFGMVLVSGISKKHLGLVVLTGIVAFGGLWFGVFQDYQKARIKTFIHPLADIRGAGYNAFQSTVAVGSGQLLGKGVGYGTQSKLQFLPEYETDFIFAAFAEEWGFVGVMFVFLLYGILVWRTVMIAVRAHSNFEALFAFGFAIFVMSHFVIHVGMNIGLLPVTGITIPFMSYGGSHLLVEFTMIGILLGMRKYERPMRKQAISNEILGIE